MQCWVGGAAANCISIVAVRPYVNSKALNAGECATHRCACNIVPCLGCTNPVGVVGAKGGGGKKNDGGFTYIFPYFSGQSLLFAVKYPLILNDSFAGTFESSSRFLVFVRFLVLRYFRQLPVTG